MKKMEWIREFTKEELDRILSDSKDALALIYNLCGLETMIQMCEFRGMSLYISNKTIYKLMREYIRKFYKNNVKELAQKLNVSEKYVYKVLKELKEMQGGSDEKRKIKIQVIRSANKAYRE